MPGYIVLVRHAATGKGAGRAIGRTPLALSAEGTRQAALLAEALHAIPFACIYSSPSARALATLAPVLRRVNQTRSAMQPPLPALSQQVMPELDEIDLGDWDGMPFAEIRQRYPDAYAERGANPARFRTPHGENFEDVSARVLKAMAAMTAGPLPALAVTHAGCIRTVLCHCTQTPLDNLFDFSPGYARPFLVAVENNTFRLAGSDTEILMP